MNHGDAELKLSAKQQSGLRSYLEMIRKFRELRPGLKIHELISAIIEGSGYLQYLQEDPETQQDRKENLDELIGKSAEWEEEKEEPSLQGFLEELTLRANVEEKADCPTLKLMTSHNSKGLEFALVFLVGLEEKYLPSYQCQRFCGIVGRRAQTLLRWDDKGERNSLFDSLFVPIYVGCFAPDATVAIFERNPC